MIDIKKIAKEHEKLFPLDDLYSQLEELEEKSKESHDAINHLVDKIADRVIAGCGLYRFDKELASGDLNICYAIGKRFNILPEIEREVERKWKELLSKGE